jgi:hypothetical protein
MAAKEDGRGPRLQHLPYPGARQVALVRCGAVWKAFKSGRRDTAEQRLTTRETEARTATEPRRSWPL